MTSPLPITVGSTEDMEDEMPVTDQMIEYQAEFAIRSKDGLVLAEISAQLDISYEVDGKDISFYVVDILIAAYDLKKKKSVGYYRPTPHTDDKGFYNLYYAVEGEIEEYREQIREAIREDIAARKDDAAEYRAEGRRAGRENA